MSTADHQTGDHATESGARQRQAEDPSPTTGTERGTVAGYLLYLQRTAGNRAVNDFLRRQALQGAAGQGGNRSSDGLAEKVPSGAVSSPPAAVQRDGDGSAPAQAAGDTQAAEDDQQQYADTGGVPVQDDGRQADDAGSPSTQEDDQQGMQAEGADAASSDSDTQAAVQELQGSDTIFGVTVGITGDLLALLGGSRASNPDLNKRNKDQYTYQQVKGKAFVKGAGDTDEVDPNDVKQGDLGDCYLLSAMAAVARANPQAIRDLIKDNGDGTYDVTLYVKNHFWSSRGPQVIKVTSSFPASKDGTPAYAKGGDKGPDGPELWPMLIEKAYAVFLGSYKDLDSGGYGADAMTILTNQDSQTLTPSDYPDDVLVKMIDTDMKNGYAITASSNWEWRDLWSDNYQEDKSYKDSGVVNLHEYSVKAAHPGATTIDLQNPWGSNDLNGMSAAKFKQYFSTVSLNKAK